MKIWIYGASDDLVEVRSDNGSITEEFPCYGDGWRGKLIAPDGTGIKVCGEYMAPGNWRISAWQLDDSRFPADWGVEIVQSAEVSYSTELIVTAPDGTVIADPNPQADGTVPDGVS